MKNNQSLCNPLKSLTMVLGTFLGATVNAQSADLILSNGEIHTPNGWVDAIAVQNGVIVGVGDTSAMRAHETGETRIIDLQGATVLPGLHDLHVHPMGAGLSRLECRFPQGSGKDQILATLAECVENQGDGEWITGGQWDAASFGDESMHRNLLDEVAPDNPVSLVDISGHSIWVNTRALELAGISEAFRLVLVLFQGVSAGFS